MLVTKRSWDAFWGTHLKDDLDKKNINTVIVCGISTNMGVESTARSAFAIGYNVVIAEDSCTAGDAAMHEFSMKQLFPRMSRVRSTDEIVASLQREE